MMVDLELSEFPKNSLSQYNKDLCSFYKTAAKLSIFGTAYQTEFEMQNFVKKT